MAKEAAIYSHGHHSSVTRDHSLRTAANSAAFLLPHIQPTSIILDVGCGTGTITADLAALAPEGKTIGGDASSSVLEQGTKFAASRDLKNLKFQQIDANALPFEDGTFDVVFCHQVLQHTKDPVAILREMRRVAKPGGIVAAREADYATFAFYPQPAGIIRWARLYDDVARRNGGEPNAGRFMHVWAREAGFAREKIKASWDSWYWARERAKAFADSWAERIVLSDFAKTAKMHGLSDDKELEEIAATWKEWGANEDALVVIPSGEIICVKD